MEEIGGLGVGGIEMPPYLPKFRRATEKRGYVVMALEDSLRKLWSEAIFCFIYRQYRASVLAWAVLIEAALKLELEKREIHYPDRFALDACIKRCKKYGILPNDRGNEVLKALQTIKTARNNIIHLNLERSDPERVLRIPSASHADAFQEDEELHEIQKHPGIYKGYFIKEYKNLARNVIKSSRRVMDFLYQR